MPGYELWSDAERKEVTDVLETGVLMRMGFDGLRKGHWKAREMEGELCNRFNTKHAHLLSSGTAALITVLTAMGVGMGDEVVMPTFTFVAGFEAIIAVGAVPVLAEIDESLTLCPKRLEEILTPRTKVIMVTHMCGSMADMDAIVAIAQKHNVKILEDSCQAIGGTYKGKALGSIGAAGTFSFDFVKLITCGEGGAIITNDTEIYTRCDQYSDHGHDHKGKDRGADLHPYIGVNYRISELNAAVGLAQIRRLPEFLALQRQNNALLRQTIEEHQLAGLTFRHIPDPEGDTGSFLSYFFPTEEQAAQATVKMGEAGLTGNFYWHNNNWHYINKWYHLKAASAYNHLSTDYRQRIMDAANKPVPQSDAVISRCISTAISLLWTEEQIIEKGHKMAAIFRECLG
ncbi:MAG: DegT/DnrJ/EryC1/StrS family aminotransferase [Chitinophagia bacterium]|nr:DegT/DnrJ/EryC1/StrS family aminotransferase [Chitinophagia bacterium]